jgi:hypothetical protein
MNKNWIFPITSAYLYTATVVTQCGYNSYFNIPQSFIEASIKENIIYFFQLFRAMQGVAGLMRWWMWIILATVTIQIVFVYFDNYISQKIIHWFAYIIMVVILLWSYNFGIMVAANTSTFYVPSSGCISSEDVSYIIPTFYQDKAVLVRYDADTMKMNGGFLVKNTSKINCEIVAREIGRISK